MSCFQRPTIVSSVTAHRYRVVDLDKLTILLVGTKILSLHPAADWSSPASDPATFERRHRKLRQVAQATRDILESRQQMLDLLSLFILIDVTLNTRDSHMIFWSHEMFLRSNRFKSLGENLVFIHLDNLLRARNGLESEHANENRANGYFDTCLTTSIVLPLSSCCPGRCSMRYARLFGRIIPHSLATDIAVSKLSPVTITVRMWALYLDR